MEIVLKTCHNKSFLYHCCATKRDQKLVGLQQSDCMFEVVECEMRKPLVIAKVGLGLLTQTQDQIM